MSAVLMFSDRSGFSLFVCKAMLPGTLILTDAKPCTVSASHVHAPGAPQGPTYLSLGRTFSMLVDTRSDGDTHDA